jgi:hypothetical protein
MKDGCDYCEKFWSNYPYSRPKPLIDNIFERYKLYQCYECKAYWEKNLRSARTIKESTALVMF